MSTPFLGELRLFSYNNTPNGWVHCNGQLMPILTNQALFALLGTTYGGDGATTFALPDLRGRVPTHNGNGHFQGEKAGATAVTLSESQMPQHLHFLGANNANSDKDSAFVAPKGTLGAVNNGYRTATNLTAIEPSTVTNVGGSQPHENRQPFLALTFMIAVQGIFPTRN